MFAPGSGTATNYCDSCLDGEEHGPSDMEHCKQSPALSSDHQCHFEPKYSHHHQKLISNIHGHHWSGSLHQLHS